MTDQEYEAELRHRVQRVRSSPWRRFKRRWRREYRRYRTLVLVAAAALMVAVTIGSTLAWWQHATTTPAGAGTEQPTTSATTSTPLVTRQVNFTVAAPGPYTAAELDTGQPWLRDFSPGATPVAQVIKHGGLVLDSPGADYLWSQGDSVTSIGVTFSFVRGATANAAVALIASKSSSESAFLADNAVFTNSIHTVVTPEHVLIGGYEDGKLTYIGDIPVGLGFGKRYTLTVERVDTDTVRVAVGDVSRTIPGQGFVKRLWGPTVGIEHYQPAETYTTDALPVIYGHRAAALN